MAIYQSIAIQCRGTDLPRKRLCPYCLRSACGALATRFQLSQFSLLNVEAGVFV